MPPKTPNKGSGSFFLCSLCGKKIPRSGSSKHTDSACQEEQFPFILRGEVTALLGIVGGKTTLPPFAKSVVGSYTLFVPEELLKEAGIKAFAWVELKSAASGGGGDSASPSVALRTWPLTDGSGGVCVTKEGSLVNNLVPNVPVTLAPLSSQMQVFPPVPCLRVSLSSVPDLATFSHQAFTRAVKRMLMNRPLRSGNSFQVRYFAEVVPFSVSKIAGLEEGLQSLSLSSSVQEYVEVTENTEFLLDLGVKRDKKEEVKLEDLGGLDAVMKEMSSTMGFLLGDTELGIGKGIVIHGQSGTGKTMLISALCNHYDLKKFVFDEFSGGLRGIFEAAVSSSPSVVVIENVDTLTKSTSDSNANLPTQIHHLMPLLKGKKTLLLSTATDIDSVSPILRSSAVFCKEIELPVPSRNERGDILAKILKNLDRSLTTKEIEEIAAITHGYVGADLKNLIVQAGQMSLERRNRLDVQFEEVLECLKFVKPSAIKSVMVDVPNVHWDDIGGQESLKFKLKQAIEWPLKHPEAFKRLGITPPKGVLMYGPPGCSKTLIAKALATSTHLNFISVKSSELFNKYVGESEKAVRDVFRKARQVSPCIVFFDEIDSLGSERGGSSGGSNVHERVLSQLLVELDGIEPLKDVTIVAATNRPDLIDKALLRPGRLDRIVYVPLPDTDTRREILKVKCRGMRLGDVDISGIVTKTEGYSGAEITAVCHEAAMKALEENIESASVENRHFLQALDAVKPRISQKEIQFYEEYSQLVRRGM